MPAPKLEWTSTLIDGLRIIAIKVPIDANCPDGLRLPTDEESERAVRLLNEEGSTIVRLLCHNSACKDKGGWIERTRTQAEKMAFYCESCGKPMER